MNENLKRQLQKLWCKDEPVKPFYKECSCVNFYNHGDVITCNCDVQEPVLKPTQIALNASNDVNPTSDRFKEDEGLNGR